MPYVARKPLTLLGEDYSPGEPVELTGLPERVAERLIEQRRVVLNVTDAPARIVHKGGRWYDVQVDGEIINDKGLSREDAEQLARSRGWVPA